MLFFDSSHWVNHSTSLTLSVGRPWLLSAYQDPTSFVGWGFPSVWRLCSAPTCGYRMLYQGWHLVDGKSNTKLMLMAESPDGVNWTPANLSTSTNPSCPVPNCVATDGSQEFSVVYDDGNWAPNSERLKALWANTSLMTSSDGVSWRELGKWTLTSIDPGISVFRNPRSPEEIVVTSRPQALRKSDGRHAGFHSGIGWEGLASGENTAALPLDSLYSPTDQFYGRKKSGAAKTTMLRLEINEAMGRATP